jgi:hypothetical protein
MQGGEIMNSATFRTDYDAMEAWTALHAWSKLRNNGQTIAFRDGFTVTIRDEYASADVFRELANIAEAIGGVKSCM